MHEQDNRPSKELLACFNNDIDTYQAELDRGSGKTLHWNDIAVSSVCFPDYNDAVIDLMHDYLGYVPEHSAMLPHEAFVKVLINQQRTGIISDEEFRTQMLRCMITIRNDDMRKGNWLRTFIPEEYEYYKQKNIYYKAKARVRHVRLLGYEPDIEYSLWSETHLRDLLAMDDMVPYYNAAYLVTDYKSATITNYRKALFLEGIATADRSPLIKYELEKETV